ncbi:MAG: hypothetical protein KAW93_09295 [Methanogenium sp.]|nr:hypothetical protein [Methanogenium sp.]
MPKGLPKISKGMKYDIVRTIIKNIIINKKKQLLESGALFSPFLLKQF